MTSAEFRDTRLLAGLSIRKAAAKLGVRPYTIQRWEAGTSRIPSEAADHLRAIAADQSN